MEKHRKEILSVILAGTIFLFFVATRLYHLDLLPEGLHIDEAGAAYDALCLSRYGVDRYLKSWPVYLINFGGGQSALYAYLTAGLFKLFGFHEILIRVPGVFFSFINLVFGMLLVRKIFPGRPYLVLGAGFLITICPYFILASRFGLDCNLMVGASTVFLYLFLCAVESGKIKYYIGAGISGGLTLYTYALSYFILPVFLVVVLLYLLRVRRFRIKGWVAMAVPMGILAFPLILVQMVNLFDLPEMQLGVFTITKLPIYRSSDLHGITFASFWTALKSIFVGDTLRYNSIPGILNLYVLTIPFFVIGLVNMFVILWKDTGKRLYNGRIFLFSWFISCLFLFSLMKTNVNRVNGIFSVVVLITVEGIWAVVKRCTGKTGIIIALFACIIYLGEFVGFAKYYYGGAYLADYKPISYFDVTVEEAVAFLDEHPMFQGKGTWMAEQKIYYALCAGASPYDMAFAEGMQETDTGYRYGSLGEIEDGYNYIVRDIFWEYAQELRDMGYFEQNYGCYSLFYKEWENEK